MDAYSTFCSIQLLLLPTFVMCTVVPNTVVTDATRDNS